AADAGSTLWGHAAAARSRRSAFPPKITRGTTADRPERGRVSCRQGAGRRLPSVCSVVDDDGVAAPCGGAAPFFTVVAIASVSWPLPFNVGSRPPLWVKAASCSGSPVGLVVSLPVIEMAT